MAKVRLTLTVCDECGDRERAVKRYRITRDGASRGFDLCEEHAKPLEALLKKSLARKRVRRTEDAVTTVEEIEKRKRQQKTG